MNGRCETRRGVVREFEDSSGMGSVADDLGRSWPFHCVEITDGSRFISTGERVEFQVEFRVLRREATQLRPLSP